VIANSGRCRSSISVSFAKGVEQAIENLYSVEGADAIRKKSLDAKAKNLVPFAAIKRFRETIGQELHRLSSTRPAMAA
jgi:hypothetical protein